MSFLSNKPCDGNNIIIHTSARPVDEGRQVTPSSSIVLLHFLTFQAAFVGRTGGTSTHTKDGQSSKLIWYTLQLLLANINCVKKQ